MTVDSASAGPCDDIQIDRLVLTRKYPDLIMRKNRAWERSDCLFEAMRDRADFRNDFLDNTARFDAFAVDVLGEKRRLQQELHAQLDRRLHITHENHAPTPGARP